MSKFTHTASCTLVFVLFCLGWLSITSGLTNIDKVPCGKVVSVEHGASTTIIEVEVNRVRARTCSMQIPFNYVPEIGKRYGQSVLIECPKDGKGCMRVSPSLSTLDISIDIPKYSRDIEYAPNHQRFDDNPDTVPFYSASMALQQTANMPSCRSNQVYSRFRVRSRTAARFSTMEYSLSTFPIALVPHNSPFNITGLQPEYDITIAPVHVTPRVPPALISNAGYIMYLTPYNVTLYFPEMMPPPDGWQYQASAPTVISLVNGKAGLLDFGYTAEAYLGINETLFFDTPVVNMPQMLIVGSLGDPEFEPAISYNPASGCLSAADWNMILNPSSDPNSTDVFGTWKWHHCGGSADCTGANWGCGHLDGRNRRDINIPLIAETPNCKLFHVGEKIQESAEISIVASIVSGLNNVLTRSNFKDVYMVSQDTVYNPNFVSGSVANSISIMTDDDSVPQLVLDPVNTITGMNCFGGRGLVAQEDQIDIDNPYRDTTTLSTCPNCVPSMMPNQRGSILLPRNIYHNFMRSGCGGMNYGPGFWQELGNIQKQFVYNHEQLQIVPKESNHTLLQFEKDFIAMSMGNRGTTGCLPGQTCMSHSPCTLFRDEIAWARTKGSMPNPVEFIFDPNNVPVTDCVFNPGTTYNEEPDAIINMTSINPTFRNITNAPTQYAVPRFKPYVGCDPVSDKPTSLSNNFWNTLSPNVWLKTNRANPEGSNKLFIEDTFENDQLRISRGVSFKVKIEIPSSQFQFTPSNVNAVDGCLNMPIVNQETQTLDFCNDLDATLDGVASVRSAIDVDSTGADTDTDFEKYVVLAVSCVTPLGGPFCLEFDPANSFVMIKDSNVTVDTTITIENIITPDNIAIHFPDVPFNTSFPNITSLGSIQISRMVFRWTQTEKRQNYLWSAAMLNRTTSTVGLGNQFREFVATLSIDRIPELITAPSTAKCDKANHLLLAPATVGDPNCNAPPPPVPPPPPPPDDIDDTCGFCAWSCHYNAGTMISMGCLWVIVAVIFLVLMAILALYYSKRNKSAQETAAVSQKSMAEHGGHVSDRQIDDLSLMLKSPSNTGLRASSKYGPTNAVERYILHDGTDEDFDRWHMHTYEFRHFNAGPSYL